MKNIKFEFFCD